MRLPIAKHKMEQQQEKIDEMEATIERLQREIQHLVEERDALKHGNLTLYKQLTEPNF